MRRIKSKETLQQEKREKLNQGVDLQKFTHKRLLLYGRQSLGTALAKNRESYEMQTQELLEEALEQGFTVDSRDMYYENHFDNRGNKLAKPRNASGNLGFEERSQIRAIMKEIEQGNGSVGVVRFYDVSRLSRDEDLVDPMSFASVCKSHGVIVWTHADIFDFSKPKDFDRFLEEAKEARNYRLYFIMGKLLVAKDRKGMRGEWVGSGVPTGFFLDDAKKHYSENVYWSPAVRGLFTRFRELDANFALLFNEIYGQALFCELPDEIRERIVHNNLTPVPGGGYTIKNRSGLKSLLCNVAYIGHINYKGVLTRNVHTPIVDEQDFLFAYNALSPVDLDGNIIERPKKVIRHATHSDVDRVEALCEGVRVNGKPVITCPHAKVYVMHYSDARTETRYRARSFRGFESDEFGIRVSGIDTLIEERALYHLENALSATDELSQAIAEQGVTLVDRFNNVATNQDSNLTTVQAQLQQIDYELAELEQDKRVGRPYWSDAELEDYYKKRARLTLRRDTIMKAEARKGQEERETEQIKKLVHAGTALEKWSKWTIAEKRKFIRVATYDIVLEHVQETWLKLTICWRHWMRKDVPEEELLIEDTAYILRRQNTIVWTEEENDILRAVYADAGRYDIMQCLPRRSWISIRSQANINGLKREPSVNDSGIPDDMSIDDMTFLHAHNLTLAPSSDVRVWWLSELCNRDGRYAS